ncbi:MAG: cell wall metabolism sensor histidine kinase WalK [Rubrobacter sp.]|nr:cell wall metabolism sensor histidine kinase WalK [Rubrobacter sp.]
MDLNRLRVRLTLGYVGVFAAILLLLGFVAVFGFSVELTRQEDELLTREAEAQAANLLGEERREVLSDGSANFSWIALQPDGELIDSDRIARDLGLPDEELARSALEENTAVSATIRGEEGRVRALSMPMYESGELVGVMQYARSLSAVQQAVRGLVLVLLPLGVGALGLAAIGGQVMAGRAVVPVQRSFERQRAFVADASHELKTPLALIRADAEVIGRGLSDPEDKELADDLLAETDKMNAMLSDLLFAARLDAGKLTVNREPFDIAESVQQVAERFAARAQETNIRIEISMSESLRATGDRERTEQVLAVLLDNALRYTRKASKITITGHKTADAVVVTVQDSGPGIAEENLERIFERFYRVDKARSREAGGSGLGLAIAQKLARAQKGTLEAGNAEEGGAVFWLTLSTE